MIQSGERGDHGPLLAGGAVKAKLAVGCVLFLLAGAWLAPRAAQTGLSVPEEHAAPLLEEQVQLREVMRPFIGVQDVAGPAAQHSVPILVPGTAVSSRNDYAEFTGSARPISGFGVFVSATQVLTHRAALDGRVAADLSLGGGLSAAARVVMYEPATGLVLLQLDAPTGRTRPPLATAMPAVGALAVAVGRAEVRELAVPVFVTSVGPDGYAIGAATNALMPGMPVFNLAGEAFAIAVPDGLELRAVPVRPAADRMLARVASGEQAPSSFGIDVQEVTGGLTDVFGSEGVVVADVVRGGPADLADVRVGDVLLSVASVPIDSAESALRALGAAAADALTPLRLRRGAVELEVVARPTAAYAVAGLARRHEAASDAPEAGQLLPSTVLDAAAVPPSARVVSVNGRRLTTPAQVDRELRRSRRSVPVLLRHGRQQFFVAVEPTR